MANLVSILMLQCSILALLISTANANNEKVLGCEKITKLRFYVQDIVIGENKTVWEVARTNLTEVLPSAFGLVSMLDNLVTNGPEMDSGVLGRIQGLIAFSDLHEMSLVMLVNVVFTEGDYKGSTLSVLGRNPLNDEIREVPIVGGTGVFRLARGYVVTTTYAVDDAHTHGVILYDALVVVNTCYGLFDI